MTNTMRLFRSNARQAQHFWGKLSRRALESLRLLSEAHSLNLTLGELQYIDDRWYVTHAGLLGIAKRYHCIGITTATQTRLCDPVAGRWVFKATVYTSRRSSGFVGYGDAEPSNVSLLIRGAEMRVVAETRAVNRALRKAYGIGLCSVEELGWEPKSYSPALPKPAAAIDNGNQNGHTRLRDRLCLLIRQHQLDANLVKAYAADSCGTPNLRDASREQIENFIGDLADWTTKDLPALLCKLNSHAKSQEGSS